MAEERIQKIMAEQGLCSRRAAEQIIAEGRVKVNGHPVKVGDKMDPHRDVLHVDDQRIYISFFQHSNGFYVTVKRNNLRPLSGAKCFYRIPDSKCCPFIKCHDHIDLRIVKQHPLGALSCVGDRRLHIDGRRNICPVIIKNRIPESLFTKLPVLRTLIKIYDSDI